MRSKNIKQDFISFPYTYACTILYQISGRPYSTETFAPAKVERENEKVNANLLLRYNGYNDEIEIGKSTTQKISEEALLKDKNLRATFNNKTYHTKPSLIKKMKRRMAI